MMEVKRQKLFRIFLCLGLCALSLPLFAAAPLQGILPSFEETSAEASPDAARQARLALLSAADKYQGTPYRYGGTDRRGMDCSGLVIASFKDALGASVPRTAAGLYTWAEKIEELQLQPGDLVFFRTTSSKSITHVGIYSGQGRFIHSASEGPKTGVIYSQLSESYWRGNYAGSGRAIPEGEGFPSEGGTRVASAPETGGPVREEGFSEFSAGTKRGEDFSPEGKTPQAKPPESRGMGDFWKSDTGEHPGRIVVGLALAPSWNGFYSEGYPVRGFASQFRAAIETEAFSKAILPGVELRPEWDAGLGVFRMPITLSIGFDDRFRIFAGPVVGAGDPVFKSDNGERHYSGGSSWFGAVGFSAAPFSMDLGPGALSPYAELAWQSYIYEGSDRNWNADLAAGLRFSTGIRYSISFNK
ncbi:MAG: C40 family peptidase [Treponema sp.]|jgi:probable lipoprotein NlpC|nr:C40 family peptidase [Treponema sp.]